jgi:hypothetical protein
MNGVAATPEYDRWLRERLQVIIEPDLRRKHREMSEDSFSFPRATFYRWAQVWPELCTDLTAAPKVLGVGALAGGTIG